MDNEPLWDPDRMVFPDDLDVNNLDQVDAWLDHPVTNALVEDLGRAFRQLPAIQQRTEINERLRHYETWRDECTAWMNHEPDSLKRAALQEVLDAINHGINGAKLRLLELDDED